jgi:hypothetical protein
MSGSWGLEAVKEGDTGDHTGKSRKTALGGLRVNLLLQNLVTLTGLRLSSQLMT